MKVRISPLKIIVMWLIVFLVLAVIVFLSFFNLFMSEWGFNQIMIISIYVVAMIIILILSINTQYYEINKKDITECKFGKKYVYYYSDIIYIDESQSERTRTLCFITKYGHTKYLNFDKEGLIYKAAKSRCSNLLTFEEVERKFPGIKI